MKTITLKNDFHGTETNIRFDARDADEAWYQIQSAAQDPRNTTSRRRLRRIEKALCGMTDCKCGTVR